ncbi:arginine/serine-rich protein 1 [Hyla sarda]|uniref:arginine/serine-rich protein 1 n=1 Tax=Hyla sarda TaxID=327740 RepID=UPI0024C394EB|nr:arginine/serine-rich protein 1 [Hyla sarda]
MTRTVELEILDAGNDSLGNKVSADATARNYSDGSSVKARNEEKPSKVYENEANNNRTKEMTNIMDDLSLNSPKDRPSRSRSKTRSIKRKSSSSSSSSSSCSSSSRSSHSRSWSRSRSRERRYQRKRSRRSSRSYSRGRSYSRSYSRSRSRSYSPRQRRRYSAAYRRYYRSPPRYRSRSRSRSYHRSRYSRSRSPSRGRRYYGFVRRPYSPTYRSYRSRSGTRSRSRTPLRLSEEEKMKLLEIAKMNASKALGKEVELPESLKSLKQPKTENSTGKKERTRHHSSSSHNSGIKVEDKESALHEQVTELKTKSPYVLWRPVTSEAKSFSKILSPKHAHTSRER